MQRMHIRTIQNKPDEQLANGKNIRTENDTNSDFRENIQANIDKTC